MTDEQLSEIEARLRAATKGPWRYEDDRGRGRIFHWVKDDEYNESGQEWEMLSFGREAPFCAPDAAFIAHAPTDIAALLAEVSRLKVELQASHDNFTRMVELNKEEQKLRDSAQEISAMAELNLRDLVHVNEVIALQRAVDGRGETIDALEDELTPLRAQLEAVMMSRDAAIEAFREHGRHGVGCSAEHGAHYRCRCGFDDAREALKGQK